MANDIHTPYTYHLYLEYNYTKVKTDKIGKTIKYI